jgi:hypothetical protein
MDSLMGMELVTALEKRLGIRLPIMLLSEDPSITRLAEKITKQLRSTTAQGEGSDDVPEHIKHVASVYASELSRERIDEVTAGFDERLRIPESGGLIE